MKTTIQLDKTEQEIINILKQVSCDLQLNTTLRVAGGWVRDKLLGKESKDLDIVLDNMSGEAFATKVLQWMSSKRMETRGIGVIQANPEQSKHLETATTFIGELPIDFAGLRTESYGSDSRIPTTEIGTPTEDALRRDFTINALFYNINENKVEDFTGRGLDDLQKGVLHTPLDPDKTFLDDPLRILRGIRFACRFGFDFPELGIVKENPVLLDALQNKVSRERVGKEFQGMLESKYPHLALELILTNNLRDIIFPLPTGASWIELRTGYFEKKFAKLLSEYDPKVCIDNRFAILLAGIFGHIDITNYDVNKSKKSQFTGKKHTDESKRRIFHLVHEVLRSLKYGNTIIETVAQIIFTAGQSYVLMEKLIHKETITRLQLGRFVRDSKDLWRESLMLAGLKDQSHHGEGHLTHHFYLLSDYENLIELVTKMNLQDAASLQSLLSGKELIDVLGIKPGPEVGESLENLIDWQLENPEATKEQARTWLTSCSEKTID